MIRWLRNCWMMAKAESNLQRAQLFALSAAADLRQNGRKVAMARGPNCVVICAIDDRAEELKAWFETLDREKTKSPPAG